MTALVPWGTKEVCRYYGITRPTVGAWRKSPHFPKPWLVSGGTVPVWDSVEVEAWHLDRKEGKCLQVLRAYRELGTINGAASRAGVGDRRAKNWLRHLGVLEPKART